MQATVRQATVRPATEPPTADPIDLGWALAPEPARSRRPAPAPRATPPRQLTTAEIDDGWVLPDDSPTAPPTAQPCDAAPQPALVDLNTATADELCQVPGIARLRASRILELRQRVGRFESVDDLAQVQGLGPKSVAALRPYLTVSKG